MVRAVELVDLENATQSRSVFWEQEIYDQEIERIFDRSWLFLTHECFIPNPGDFVTGLMAENNVIVARQKDGTIRAMLNACTHRGNLVCPAESGNSKAFVCNYHGWVFGLDGALVDVPMEERCYHNKLDKSEKGLRQIRVEAYRGFVFGCFDENAPNLEDYLGDFTWYLDTFMVGPGAGMELAGPPMKSLLKCNWKVPTENFIGDGYHVGWTHASALQISETPLSALAGNRADMPFDDLGMQFTMRHGHGFGVIYDAVGGIHEQPSRLREFVEKTAPIIKEKFGPERAVLYSGHWNSSIFPNCSFLYGTNTFKVWHPRGPHETEVWTYVMVPKDADEATRRETILQASRTFGTAGTLESDDGDNMVMCTRNNRGSQVRDDVMDSSMGVGAEGRHPAYPGIVGKSFIGETSYRGFYRFWAEMMDAPDWAAIRQNDENWDAIWRDSNVWNGATG